MPNALTGHSLTLRSKRKIESNRHSRSIKKTMITLFILFFFFILNSFYLFFKEKKTENRN